MIRPAAVGLAAVIGGAVGAASMTAAMAVTVPLAADFGVVLPGETVQASTDVSVPVPSVVTEAGWLERSGDGVWGADLCSPAVCTPLEALEGTPVAAGDYRVVISMTMPMDASAPGRTTAQGRISLMESIELPLADGLAATGSTVPWIAAIGGALALGGGTAILIRRRTHQKEETR